MCRWTFRPRENVSRMPIVSDRSGRGQAMGWTGAENRGMVEVWFVWVMGGDAEGKEDDGIRRAGLKD